MGEDHQLLPPAFAVVEDGHGAFAHDDQLLLLEGMEPRHENVGVLAARKREMRGGDVGHRLRQVVGADRGDAFGLLADQRQDHRNVVRREAPQDALLAPDLPEIEPARVEVAQPAELAVAYRLLQPDEGSVVLQQMADHQGAFALSRDSAQRLGMADVERQRLLDEDVLCRLQRLGGEREVLGRRRRDRDAGDGPIPQHLGERTRRDLVFLGHVARGLAVHVAHRRPRIQFVEVANEILSPITAPDDGDHGGRPPRLSHRDSQPLVAWTRTLPSGEPA